MLKQLMLGAAIVAGLGLGTMSATPAAADPTGCNCTWMAVSFDPETNEFGYAWVCPTTPICNEQVDPGTP